ncbi:uncharacterized protein [Amphiura filiformis]|uniref:uncharacterized protein n=1 Tax=Amphiura filiformis TaxID=82378 RepID=UPI003B21C46D
MPHKMKLEFECMWKKVLTEKFNVIAVGKLFRQTTGGLVVGCEDGVIRLYHLPASSNVDAQLQLKLCLETKGGPLQSLVLDDVTKFGSTDVISGDSRGTVTIFCNGQILNRQSVSGYSVNCLQVDKNATGNLSIVCGDSGGNLNALLPYSQVWKCQLGADSAQAATKSPSVKCLLAATLASSSGQASNYVLAGDDCKMLHFLQQGTTVHRIQTPAVVTAMCCGQWLTKDEVDVADTRPGVVSQVALGGHDGSVYIMSNFQVHVIQYCNVLLPITQLSRLPSIHGDDLDLLLVAGHFSSVFLYHAKQLICKCEVPDWVNTMTVADIDHDGNEEVIVGCQDQTICALKLR